ncbi:MAG: sodium:solute symporter, partial [Calditrichaeota bacterium]|nr:sodium:solute symporter [Calditrichota bacterium]
MNLLNTLDLSIVILSFIALIVSAYLIGRRQNTVDQYFLTDKSVPWWAICGSIVATETSTLSFIGFPAISFFGNLNFVQLLFGYVIGRYLISYFLLPDYFSGDLRTSYQFLEQKFGKSSRKTSSVLFIITRLLGDGVRLYATAIPLKLLTGWSYDITILIIVIVTIVFSVIGGLKTIIWTDFSQLLIYLGGAAVVVIYISLNMNLDFSQISDDKLAVFNFAFSFSEPYTFYWSIIGGVLLTLSSHGTDQLLVQRILAARNYADGKKALITSGYVVFFQALFFLLIGLLLYLFYQQNSISFDSSQRNEIFPYFIVHYLPSGMSGLVVASIFAAAISTLSSSLSSMASSAVFDFKDDSRTLNSAKLSMLLCGFALGAVALITQTEFARENVLTLGLSIASILYGGI